MTYQGSGVFDVDGETLTWDFKGEEFVEKFPKEVYDEAWAIPAFQADYKTVTKRVRDEMRRYGPNWEFSPEDPELYEV